MQVLTTLPVYWQNRNQPEIRNAIKYYQRCLLSNPISLDASYHQEQIEIVRGYFAAYISADCWNLNHWFAAEVAKLRSSIITANTVELLNDWSNLAKLILIDPL